MYRLATTAVGRRTLARLGKRIQVEGFDNPPPTPKHPLVICLTIDTEGGYVADDATRIWQGRAPESFEGYIHGIPNMLGVLAKHEVKATFFVSPHGLSARGAESAAVTRAITNIVREGHEVGLHLHPTSDRALQARFGRVLLAGHASALDAKDRRRLIDVGRAMLEEIVAADLSSFRWGNWALDARSARSVADAGFRFDSSAVPGLRDRKEDPPRFDWSTCRRRSPWELAPNLLELPIATFQLFGTTLRADPLYASLLDAAFDAYLRRAPRREAPFPFVVMTHTTEATHRDGSATETLRDLDRFLARARAFSDVVFAPIAHADVTHPL